MVAVDVEVRQRKVIGHIGMGVVAQREIAAVDVHPAQAVAMPCGGVEAGLQHRCLLRWRQLLPDGGGRLGEGAAKAQQGLELAPAVHPHRGRPVCAAGQPGSGG